MSSSCTTQVAHTWRARSRSLDGEFGPKGRRSSRCSSLDPPGRRAVRGASRAAQALPPGRPATRSRRRITRPRFLACSLLDDRTCCRNEPPIVMDPRINVGCSLVRRAHLGRFAPLRRQTPPPADGPLRSRSRLQQSSSRASLGASGLASMARIRAAGLSQLGSRGPTRALSRLLERTARSTSPVRLRRSVRGSYPRTSS